MGKHAKIALSALAVVSAIATLVAFSPRAIAQSKPAGVDKLTYHHNRQRTGWNDRETVLTPQKVSSPEFGLLWESAMLDSHGDRPPRLFATPLYVHAVQLTHGPLAGRTLSALYVMTTTGFAYAINAAKVGTTAPGEVLWRQQLTAEPCSAGALGNLSTPIIDLERHRFYVTTCTGSQDSPAIRDWRVHALDIRNGESLPGWPVSIDPATLNAPGVNKNGGRRWTRDAPHTQRGALNLSPDASRLYVAFGPDPGGWIVSLDTVHPRVASAFSSTAVDEEKQGGMWQSGGPSVDEQGYVHIATGANVEYARVNVKAGTMVGVSPESPGHWGQSILQLRDDPVRGFELTGTYTPFNYCIASANDIDLGSSGTVVIDLDPATTSTPRLLALGGAKQGNLYLLNRAPMPGNLTRRQPCSRDAASDLSLLAPDIQPQFGTRGPLNLFGPYSDTYGMVDQARSRSTLAYFRDASGDSYVFVTGAAKTGANLVVSVPPGLAKVQIVTNPGRPAHLRVAQFETTQTLPNPGSPIVTSNGPRDAVVWVLDTNAERTAPLYGSIAPRPVLYAFDASNLKLLWKSAPGQLSTSGKYNEPTVVNGVAYVGTDRIQAFGLRATPAK